MVGGGIIGVNNVGEALEVVCQCRTYHGVLAVKIKKAGPWRALRPRDDFWWQGRSAYWTPQENAGKSGLACGKDYDIRFERLGYSYTPSHLASMVDEDETD
jgi:hypothetical protein